MLLAGGELNDDGEYDNIEARARHAPRQSLD